MITSYFFDFDGTLQGFDSHQISDSTKEALYLLKKKGSKLFLATGRNLIDTPKELEKLGFDGYINNNGGRCSDGNRNSFYTAYLPQSDVEALMRYSKIHDFAYSIMTEQSFQINRVTEYVELSFQYFKLDFPKLINYDEIELDKIMQMNLFVDEVQEHEIMKQVMPNCNSSRWMSYFADINPKGISKMKGIEKMAERYQIDLTRLMAFGDGGNDILMIQGCTIGVAMGNANQSLKDVADYVTTSADDDGIWNALKFYELI